MRQWRTWAIANIIPFLKKILATVIILQMAGSCERPFWTCDYELQNSDTIRLTEKGASVLTSNTMDIEYCANNKCTYIAQFSVGNGPILQYSEDNIHITVYSKKLKNKPGRLKNVVVKNYPKEKFLQDPEVWNRLVDQHGILHACAEKGRRIN